MKKYRHHLLWLSLPAALVGVYFVIFQPGPDSTPAVNETAYIDTGPVQNTAPAMPDELVDIDTAALPVPTTDGQKNEEIARDREFINYAFPLLSTWNLQEVKPLLADATIEASTDEELNEVMSVLGDRLGNLKYFETPQPVATRMEADEAGDATLQHYQFSAYFETAEAEIDLILHKQHNDNSLYSFNIHVPD